MSGFRDVLLVLAVCAAWPGRADAQIYTWLDASGTVVYSDRKIDSPTAVHEVAGTTMMRTTLPDSALAHSEGAAPVTERAGRFDPLVVEHAARHAIRPALVRAVIQVESGFNPLARSPKGAMGLMQLMPGTARELGVDDPYDPAQNIRGGTAYLRQLLNRYGGDERLALAAYNAGAGAVDRHGRDVPPYRETQEYVKKVGSRAGASGAAVTPKRPGVVIYKSVEIINGRAVPRYSSVAPVSGTYERLER